MVSRVVTPLLYGAVSALFVAGLQSLSAETGFTRLERDAYAWHLLQRPSRDPHPDVVLVGVDDPAYTGRSGAPDAVMPPPGLEEHRLPGCECPAPRICYALAIDRLKQWGARAVVLDVWFRSRCAAPLTPGTASEDEQLAAAIRRAGNVVISAVPEARPLDRTGDPLITYDLILHHPIRPIRDAAGAAIGSPRVDPYGREYAVELEQAALTSDGPRTFYSLPYLAWRLYRDGDLRGTADLSAWSGRLAESAEPRLLGRFFSQGIVGVSAPPPHVGAPPAVDMVPIRGDVLTDEAFFRKRLLIDFSTGAEPSRGRYGSIRLSRLLDMGERDGRDQFQGKIAILGMLGRDPHGTAVGMMPGSEVLAHATATLIRDRPIVVAPTPLVLALMFVLAAAASLAIRSFPSPAAAIAVLGELALLQFAAGWLIRDHNVWLMVASPSAALLLSAFLTTGWETVRVRDLVARLLPTHISRVLERAGGFQVEEGTVLFSDIRGYSTFSEHLEPAVVMTHLNAYFAAVHEILRRHRGHFVKSPGDCVVAWFADERGASHHAERAMRAALELVENAGRFQDPWKAAGLHPFNVGVGINTGPMAVGVLDAHRHIEPTLIGDSVNLAERIERLKLPDASILVSDATLAPVREKFIAESMGEVTVAGRVQPVHIYRIDGLAPAASTSKRGPFWKGPAQDP